MKRNQQTTHHILMVRPANFGFNEQTAASNAFQTQDQSLSIREVRETAIAEFDAFVSKLREAGVEVHVMEDSPRPIKTDAVFPNNWVTFHADGTVITYPMLSENRRLEREESFLNELGKQFRIVDRKHFEQYEEEGYFLEGTGSMILDRRNKIVYACSSARTDTRLLDLFCKQMGYKAVVFKAVDQGGLEIYHTNVMMALGEDFVVICLESVMEPGDRELLNETFQRTNKKMFEITYHQMMAFAGNMLQVRTKQEQLLLIMSEQAYNSLEINQIRNLEQHTKILHAAIPTIEKFGGGSVRCMMAEVFLPET